MNYLKILCLKADELVHVLGKVLLYSACPSHF